MSTTMSPLSALVTVSHNASLLGTEERQCQVRCLCPAPISQPGLLGRTSLPSRAPSHMFLTQMVMRSESALLCAIKGQRRRAGIKIDRLQSERKESEQCGRGAWGAWQSRNLQGKNAHNGIFSSSEKH